MRPRAAKRGLPRHLKQLSLPRLHNLDHGDLVPMPELAAWMVRQQGRWRWCGRCRVARRPEQHEAHREIHKVVAG